MSYLLRRPDELAWRTLEHVELVALALAIAIAIALPLGIACARYPRIGGLVLGALNVVYTIPSLALLALLVPLLGIGTPTALVALVVYAQMILVRNVVVGLRGVAPSLVDAARGLGMSRRQTLWRVEFPQALPVMLAGVRLATITLIALATLAAWVNAGGLGRIVLYGLQHDDPDRALAGAIVAALLAIGADRLLAWLERRSAAPQGDLPSP
ncbi:MAG: ABC transporter permease [Candidatus Eremiobacteraeota bacterium]|nr:ABC transporter permease [Candidatus Eremiobacteraeota bacterium]